MKIIVDREKCIGAASCVVIAEKTFRLDDEAKAEVFHADDGVKTVEESSGRATEANDVRETIIDAARSCPTQAIRLEEDDGTPIVL